MASAFFPSLPSAEIIDVEFLTPVGNSRAVRLLVDSGFTGKSSFVLSNTETELVWAPVPAARAAGALQGRQQRAWVTCRVPQLSFEATLIAILSDITLLSLPRGVEGMVGLRFLRQFKRWGAERNSAGDWQFVLSDDHS